MAINPIYQRMQLLTGTPALRRLNEIRVIVLGLGGVGSWAAEALVRSGVTNITLVDNDVICITNVNRQLQATTRNVGKAKVDELADRLLTLNPRCRITRFQDFHTFEFQLAWQFTFGLQRRQNINDLVAHLRPNQRTRQRAGRCNPVLAVIGFALGNNRENFFFTGNEAGHLEPRTNRDLPGGLINHSVCSATS